VCHHTQAFFGGILESASSMDLQADEIDKLRAEQWALLQEKQAKVRAREEEMKREEDSDDEITFSDDESDDESEADRLARLAAQ
jgi:hypothetical protein